MKFAYKFNNLLGTVYRKGNILFTPDGNSVISPVGNRITIYDLKNNKAKTLSLESRYNYTAFDLSPNGCLLVAANENSKVQIISMVSYTVINSYTFREQPTCIKFSPDGKYFAIAHAVTVSVYLTPGDLTGQYNSFIMYKAFLCSNDDVTTIDWSFDSKLMAVGNNNNSTTIVNIEPVQNINRFILTGHTEPIVGVFFEEKSFDINTISRNGQLCLWECSLNSEDLALMKCDDEPTEKRHKETSDSEDEIDTKNIVEKDPQNKDKNEDLVVDEIENRDEQGKLLRVKTAGPKLTYKKIVRHFLADEPRKANRNAILSSAAYHKKLKLLICSFSTGDFYLYEMPDVNIIHSLNISEYSITSSCFNCVGDWIALASAELGQMLVWEWQSEQYIMKQQGHASEMTCISYSPDGQYIATGGEDSKVKLWNVSNGFCFVTFSEHTSGVSAIQFSSNKKFVVSVSLDGTVRAYDIIRYRNFRTFTTPQPVQFGSVAIDVSSELVAAGGLDVFEIYLWSIKLGRLLEVISGHEGPVSCLAFSPVQTSTTLISGSWDKTIKIWNSLESSSEHETIDMITDVMAISFKPDGEEVAVATLNGSISIFDLKLSRQIAIIEGKTDLGSGRSETDLITAKKNLEGKSFTSIAYSADGECILGSGKSKNVCIYHVKEGILLKKFEITQNQSFDSINEFVNRRNMTEFGNLALIEEREELEGGNVKIRLPGVVKGDMAARNFKPEVNVFSIRFSPTGQSWAAATTEGLLIYSLDKGMVFDPYQLSMEITPKSTKQKLSNKEFSGALLMALKLNEPGLVHQVIEEIPFKEIELVVSSLPDEFLLRTLQFITKILNSSPHIEFYLKWSNLIVTNLGQKENILPHHTLVNLQQNFNRKYDSLSKICNFNKYTLKLIKDISKIEMEKDRNDLNNDNMSDDDEDEGLLLVKTNGNHEDEYNDVEMKSDDDDDFSE